MSSPPQRLPRRTVMRAGVAGGVALIGLPVLTPAGCGGDAAKALPSGPISAGAAADVAVGTLRAVRGESAFIGRDDAGFYAMTAVCTHAGCRVQEPTSAAAGMQCLCHGSMFDRNGGVTRGPAQAALQHYRVDVGTDGTLTIRGDLPVGSGDRTPLPASGV